MRNADTWGIIQTEAAVSSVAVYVVIVVVLAAAAATFIRIDQFAIFMRERISFLPARTYNLIQSIAEYSRFPMLLEMPIQNAICYNQRDKRTEKKQNYVLIRLR